jgi:xanthine/uracil permease
MAVDFAPPTLFDQVTPSLRILASDGIVIGTVMAVLLNLLLPDKD